MVTVGGAPWHDGVRVDTQGPKVLLAVVRAVLGVGVVRVAGVWGLGSKVCHVIEGPDTVRVMMTTSNRVDLYVQAESAALHTVVPVVWDRQEEVGEVNVGVEILTIPE